MNTPVNYFVDINKLILKFTGRGRRPRRANLILKGKNKIGGATMPNFKTYYNAAVLKTAWYWYTNRSVDRTELKNRHTEI